MRVFADFHLHSYHSRATSKNLTIANLEKYGKMKGIGLLGTGDLTHPKWLAEMKPQLTDNGEGILETKGGFKFVLSGEISLIYSQGGKGRRIHLILLAPGFEVAEQIQEALLKFGRIDYDGRPIFGRSCPLIVETLKGIDNRIEIIPAHIWTPWFSLFGSRSGFDSVEDCFQDQTKHIHAMETGLSSDPPMNWRLSALDKYTMVSNSDAHSFWPWRLGRECNLMDLKEWSYDAFIKVLRTGEGLLETIEFWPEEGKYHYDGHRKCGLRFSPKESKKYNNICPQCKQPLTIGVLNRVEELADREEGFKPKNATPYRNIIPLHELIGGALDAGVATKKVWAVYNPLIEHFGNEMTILFDAKEEELAKQVEPLLVKLILANREQSIPVSPGYDGVYGVPDFSSFIGRQPRKEKKEAVQVKKGPSQKGLSDYF